MQLGATDRVWTISELVQAALTDVTEEPQGRKVGRFMVIEGGNLMCFGWKKVRRANIPNELRHDLDRMGEYVVASAMAMGAQHLPLGVFSNLDIQINRIHVWNWLQEQRDVEERAHNRMETAEWAVLVFVVIGTLTELATLAADFVILGRVS